MKAIILGIPGTGTSYFANLLSAAGWSDAGPTFSRSRYGYPNRESLLGRAVNRVAMGHSGLSWPVERWHADYRPRNPYNDPECHALARYFVKMNGTKWKDWYFKNPESLLFYKSVWARFKWDHVIGVYRHPKDSMSTLRQAQQPSRRYRSWLRWTRKILICSTILVRFPDDGPRLCDALGIEMPDGFELTEGRPRQRTEEEPDPWAMKRWEQLEAARWSPEREAVS